MSFFLRLFSPSGLFSSDVLFGGPCQAIFHVHAPVDVFIFNVIYITFFPTRVSVTLREQILLKIFSVGKFMFVGERGAGRGKAKSGVEFGETRRRRGIRNFERSKMRAHLVYHFSPVRRLFVVTGMKKLSAVEFTIRICENAWCARKMPACLSSLTR